MGGERPGESHRGSSAGDLFVRGRAYYFGFASPRWDTVSRIDAVTGAVLWSGQPGSVDVLAPTATGDLAVLGVDPSDPVPGLRARVIAGDNGAVVASHVVAWRRLGV